MRADIFSNFDGLSSSYNFLRLYYNNIKYGLKLADTEASAEHLVNSPYITPRAGILLIVLHFYQPIKTTLKKTRKKMCTVFKSKRILDSSGFIHKHTSAHTYYYI